MIGDAYKSAAIQAVIGPAHSSVIPDVLWGAWLDAGKALIEMTGNNVSHDDFGESGDGVANTAVVDAGLYPASAPSWFAVYDAATSGAIVALAPVTFDTTPPEDGPITFAPGELNFTYDDGA